MGKLIMFPGGEDDPRSRAELVAEASDLIMKEVVTVFEEQEMEPRSLDIWHREVRDYFWREEFKMVNRRFRPEDLKRWRHFWRDQTLEYIRSKTVR